MLNVKSTEYKVDRFFYNAVCQVSLVTKVFKTSSAFPDYCSFLLQLLKEEVCSFDKACIGLEKPTSVVHSSLGKCIPFLFILVVN